MDNSNSLIFSSKPSLRNPCIVCGLNGWVNGGEVSVGGIQYLIKHLKAEKFAEMPASRYHVYQVPGVESLRPVFKTEEGIIEEAQLPRNQFYYAVNRASDHDLILFLGIEPSLYWEEYADAIVNLALDFKASRLYTFGGVLDKTPHTREPKVTCSCTSAEVKDEMQKYGVGFLSREGPATFNTMLLWACKQ
jgi:proteasome assembly chaperone (PAC2) family protein